MQNQPAKGRLSRAVTSAAATRDAALRAFIAAHQQAVQQQGRMLPLPNPRDIDLGGVTIPKEIAKHIGRWGVPVPVDPEGFKRPGERW